MASVYYGGLVRMNPEMEDISKDPMLEGGYPHTIPKVFIEGHGEAYFPQYCFDWDDDSVVLVREKRMVKYTRSSFVELLAKNEEGDVVWMDGRTAPYSSCCKGEYLNEYREGQEYTVTEYDFETMKKKKYKVILDEVYDIKKSDRYSVENYVDEETLAMVKEIPEPETDLPKNEKNVCGFTF